jgi:hypothetical protein
VTQSVILCVTCPVLRPKGKPRPPNRPMCCDGCRERLTTDLGAIPDAYAFIDTEPVTGAGERRTVGFESRPPVNVSGLSLLGAGSVIPATEGTPYPQDQLGTVPPLDLLAWWVEDWIVTRAMREHMPDMLITSVTIWLTTRLEWACDHHPAVDEFAQDLRELTGQLRAYGGRDRGERVGNCPRSYGDDHCNTPLYVDPYVDEIECSRCHMKWKRKAGEWLHLRAQQLGAGVEAVA